MSNINVSENPYFREYGDYQVHKLMLLDEARTASYKKAILENSQFFKDKIVMDIGAGTGILSMFCAQAGAKKVYAIEAVPSLADLITEIATANQFSEVITVIKGEVENLSLLTTLKEKSIDIIVSEWMGFFLLHEGMLDSVLSARKYLKDDGMIFPDKCVLQAALCELPEYFNWEIFHGLNMSIFGKELRTSSQTQPQICTIKKSQLLSEPIDIFSFDIKSVATEMIQNFEGKYVVPASRDGRYHGVCIWFKVTFPSSSNEIYELSTSPFSTDTHWKQTVIVFEEEHILKKQMPVGFEIIFKKNGPRTYSIEFIQCEENSLTHPMPCDCLEIKCQIIKTFLMNSSLDSHVAPNSEPEEYSYDPEEKRNNEDCQSNQPLEYVYEPHEEKKENRIE